MTQPHRILLVLKSHGVFAKPQLPGFQLRTLHGQGHNSPACFLAGPQQQKRGSFHVKWKEILVMPAQRFGERQPRTARSRNWRLRKCRSHNAASSCALRHVSGARLARIGFLYQRY